METFIDMAGTVTERVPQAQRSAAMRARLLDAAVECLAELGYAGTTTSEIVARAGVSRGAQLHHFRTKDELLAAAVQHTMDQRLRQFQEAMQHRDPDVSPMEAAIDLLWAMFSGQACDAWIELAVAARTNESLRTHVREMAEHHRQASELLFRSLVPATPGTDPEFYEIAAKFALAVFDGVMLHKMSGYDDGPGRAEEVVLAMKRLARMALPG